jgi:hypothetical protein
MRTAIMQPYFLPYLGYFQLISAVDTFVIYDTIQYTKRGWINRNQMLRNGAATMFSIPLKKDSDYLNVVDRHISEAFEPSKLCNQISGAYRKAPEFNTVMPLIESILLFRGSNLFEYIHNSIVACCDHLNLKTTLRISSDVEGGSSSLRNTDRVIDICKRTNAAGYVNPPGGRDLYSSDVFQAQGIELQFLQPRLTAYPQFGDPFVPSLSILDVMMFNSREKISKELIPEYNLAK